jgi:hypothetical protein
LVQGRHSLALVGYWIKVIIHIYGVVMEFFRTCYEYFAIEEGRAEALVFPCDRIPSSIAKYS